MDPRSVNLSEIPEGPLVDIFKLLGAVELFNLRRVCTRFRDLIKNKCYKRQSRRRGSTTLHGLVVNGRPIGKWTGDLSSTGYGDAHIWYTGDTVSGFCDGIIERAYLDGSGVHHSLEPDRADGILRNISTCVLDTLIYSHGTAKNVEYEYYLLPADDEREPPQSHVYPITPVGLRGSWEVYITYQWCRGNLFVLCVDNRGNQHLYLEGECIFEMTSNSPVLRSSSSACLSEADCVYLLVTLSFNRNDDHGYLTIPEGWLQQYLDAISRSTPFRSHGDLAL